MMLDVENKDWSDLDLNWGVPRWNMSMQLPLYPCLRSGATHQQLLPALLRIGKPPAGELVQLLRSRASKTASEGSLRAHGGLLNHAIAQDGTRPKV